jgi:hypothetical protein
MLAERSELKLEPLRRDQIGSTGSESALASEYQFSPIPKVTLDRNGCICRMNTAAADLLKGELSPLFKVPFIAFTEKSYCHVFLDLSTCLRFRRKSCAQLILANRTRATGSVELQTGSLKRRRVMGPSIAAPGKSISGCALRAIVARCGSKMMVMDFRRTKTRWSWAANDGVSCGSDKGTLNIDSRSGIGTVVTCSFPILAEK